MRNSFLFIFIVASLFFSCGNDRSTAADFSEAPAIELDYEEESKSDFNGKKEKANTRTNAGEEIARPRQIIKTANYRFQVKNVDEGSTYVKNVVKDFSGYIVSMNEQSSNYDRSNNITIRVPGDKFEKLLDTLLAKAVFVNYKRINSRDVTEEFVDLEIRLQTKKDVRKKYIELLRNKAKSVEDVLAAEDAIRRLTEEIEAKEGRLKFLKNQVNMSTVHLEIYEKVEYRNEPGTYHITFWDRLTQGFANGWSLLVSLFIGIINIWPIAILLTLIIWQRKRIFKFRKQKKEE